MNKQQIEELKDEKLRTNLTQAEMDEFRHLHRLDMDEPEEDLEEREAMGMLAWENTINEN